MSKIVADPSVMNGKPFIVGTEVSVESIVKYADQGATMAQLLKIFPTLAEADIQAAIKHSAPSPLKRFIRDQAFLGSAIVFALVTIVVMALGGLALSVNLSRAGWPTALSLLPVILPAAASAIIAYVLIRRA